ncbi:hypothetical protein FRZ67_18765 [Panacibacter ginsenosidivorans]|uniref:Heavy metal binding domain-containing protein n=1 Tax=Panacibacter ginsenosidivorans TaxID=1813871 RepID=A0A5B8VE28_9BACT|nr:heavy metal-binding domain-containing protein [Panacibacter ginsenosidivorans]QEC69251.1 hypothetical protein FRZ67_18765 [Panacibacter ginsenosidivorans]
MKKLIILLFAVTASLATFAQKAKAPTPEIISSTVTVIETYSCPMHPDVTSDKTGKCTKCGSDLLLSKKELLKREVVKIYSCSMHPEVVSYTAGKCSRCGMDLLVSKKEQLKREVVRLYTCGMHPEVVSDTMGRCPVCGMGLVEKKSTADNKTPM